MIVLLFFGYLFLTPFPSHHMGVIFHSLCDPNKKGCRFQMIFYFWLLLLLLVFLFCSKFCPENRERENLPYFAKRKQHALFACNTTTTYNETLELWGQNLHWMCWLLIIYWDCYCPVASWDEETYTLHASVSECFRFNNNIEMSLSSLSSAAKLSKKKQWGSILNI